MGLCTGAYLDRVHLIGKYANHVVGTVPASNVVLFLYTRISLKLRVAMSRIPDNSLVETSTDKFCLSNERLNRKNLRNKTAKSNGNTTRSLIWDKLEKRGLLKPGTFIPAQDFMEAEADKFKFDTWEALPVALLKAKLAPIGLDGGAWLVPLEYAYADLPEATELLSITAKQPTDWEIKRISGSESGLRQWLGSHTTFWQTCYDVDTRIQDWDSPLSRSDLGWIAAGSLVRDAVNRVAYQPDICVRLLSANRLIIGEHKRASTHSSTNFALRQVFIPHLAESLALSTANEPAEISSVFLMSFDIQHHLLVEINFELANMGRYNISRAIDVTINWE